MSLFFNLLPADVLKDILYDWLNPSDGGRGLLRALSALDIASSKHHQSALRSLIRQLPPFGKHSSEYKPSAFTQHTVNFVLWLCSRKVPIRSLYLGTSGSGQLRVLEQRKIHLPTVEFVCWFGPIGIILGTGTGALLRCCPNVTSIESPNFVGFALALEVSDIPKLKVLTLNGPTKIIPPLNRFCGPGLQELRVASFHLDQLPEIGEMSPFLKVLEVTQTNGKFSEFLLVVQSLECLTDLTVRVPQLLVSEISGFVALPNITSLSIQTDCGYSDECACFAHILVLRSNWKCIQIDGCKYTPSDGLLQLTNPNDASIVTTILEKCTSVDALLVNGLCDMEIARLIGEMLGKQLKALDVSSPMNSAVSSLLDACGSELRRLSLDGMGAEGQLQLVATRCVHLESLSVGPSVRLVTANELTVVFSGCPQLKELVIRSRLEVKALQAIFDKSIRLRRLEVNAFGEVDWFRQQVKCSQLLPMPELVLTNIATSHERHY